MDEYHILNNNSNEKIVLEISSRISKGEVGIIPTETVYGLVCAFNNLEGKDRIYQIKNRDPQKKLQILIRSVKDIGIFNISDTVKLMALGERFWPGPLTILIKNELGHELGFRIPHHKFTSEVLEAVKIPLFATSANYSGSLPEDSFKKKFSDLTSLPDFMVLSDEKLSSAPSTIIRLENHKIELIREGEIPFEEITKELDDLPIK